MAMAERDLLVMALRSEVLGPRGGAWELLGADEDPLDEYITGVLAPRTSDALELDAEDEATGEEDAEADDQTDPGDPASLGLTVPALDPRTRPASVGLSFTVEAAQLPTVDVCCTWARYETESGGWLRSPRVAVLAGIACVPAPAPIDLSSDPDVKLVVRARPALGGGRFRISLFLVNATPCGVHERPTTIKHVFQPQIRVLCCEGVHVVPSDEPPATDDVEEADLSFLYRHRRSMARGHLCSATWRSLDPERPIPNSSASPFGWSDVTLLSQHDQQRFTAPDVRTEYTPFVEVMAPTRTWPENVPQPELAPDLLSELWDAGQVRNALEPLADGYDTWIRDQEAHSTLLDPIDLATATRQLALCRDAAARLRNGIDLVAADDDVRLAFCFANRAIALQSRWLRGASVNWYPFQLAFQLINLPALANPLSPERSICDLLWFPTGGGKTEAYLGLAAFCAAYRRLVARQNNLAHSGGGTAVLSRYTLRLLTIQQFRRALALVTAAEMLRVSGPTQQRGWRPSACPRTTDALWGEDRFSIGLWVGGGVTPNGLQDIEYMDRNRRMQIIPGAISLLEGRLHGDSEPAQILSCPACRTILALPPELPVGESILLQLILGDVSASVAPAPSRLTTPVFLVTSGTLTAIGASTYSVLSVQLTPQTNASATNVDAWVRDVVLHQLGSGTWCRAARPSRPGYFIRTAPWGHRRNPPEKPLDFELHCPNPDCELNQLDHWWESTPTGPWPVDEPFNNMANGKHSCPIPAFTVDEQLYARCPSMVIATVDKFARLAFDERGGTLFGNVDLYNQHLGYHRRWSPPTGPGQLPTTPLETVPIGANIVVQRFDPPDLILQDELHLIEGPLGSMVGLYETVIDLLSASPDPAGSLIRPKYIASTATVRRAQAQVESLFLRELRIFPPPAISSDNSFFARVQQTHPADATAAGRLYIGICAPGRGAQTPIVRIWSRLLQHVYERLSAGAAPAELDRFWTLVGYFNAVRELAGAVALFRQDIQQRIGSISPAPRPLDETEPLELSSRADSLALPRMLDQLAVALLANAQAVNAVAATSMFGTGVDVERLGLMVVHGQPKTTSSYIQATGRVGRSAGGLVATFYRASRPRDLNHYEFFVSYHSAFYRYVEPITVSPFSPRARDRGMGPIAVAALRQASRIRDSSGVWRDVDESWRVQQRLRGSGGWISHAGRMAGSRGDPEVMALPDAFETRAQGQPGMRRPTVSDVRNHAASELDRWQQLAHRNRARLLYQESTMVNPAASPVVLGDLAHTVAGLDQAYEDAPNSLREVEATTTFAGRV